MGSRSKKKQQQREDKAKDIKIAIGIISYLPDDMQVKMVRVARLNALFKQCDALLNLPIMIVAQNWEGITLQEGTIRQSISIYKYPKLGITGARNKLRELFLASDYDYLIMLDDDSQLTGKLEDSSEYIRQIKLHPGMYCEYKPQLLKLFAISKEVYSLIELPEGGADYPEKNRRFFEDMMLIKTLDKLYHEKKFVIPHKSFMEVSDAAWDKYNSGWHQEVYDSEGVWDRHKTGDITRALVKNVKKGPDGKVQWVWPIYVKPNTNWDNY